MVSRKSIPANMSGLAEIPHKVHKRKLVLPLKPMANGYLLILFFGLGGFGFAGLVYLVSLLLQNRRPNPEKLSAYECGEPASATGKTSFQFRYYLPAVIFLLFEVEMVLMVPVLLSRNRIPADWTAAQWQDIVRWESVLFFFILLLGFALALAARYFDWEKPRIPSPVFESPVPDIAYEQFNLEQMRMERAKESRPEMS